MDFDEVNPQDVAKLNPADKAELARFAENERQKASIQSGSHHLTNLCWKQCVTSSITSGTLDKNESPCLANCVGRYMDAQVLTIKHLQTLRN